MKLGDVNDQKMQLKQLGYKEAEVEKLIILSESAMQLVLDNTKFLKINNFILADIVQIVSSYNGVQKLKVVIDNFEKLKNFKSYNGQCFTVADIVNIVLQHNGVQNLKMVVDNFDLFDASGFTVSDIIEKVLSYRATQRIEDMLETPSSSSESFNQEFLCFLDKAIEDVKEITKELNYQPLLPVQNISHNQTQQKRNPESNSMSSVNFSEERKPSAIASKETIKAYLFTLHKLGYSREESIKIMKRFSSEKSVLPFIAYTECLMMQEFKLSDIFSFVDDPQGPDKMKALIHHSDQLKKLGYHPEQMLKMVKYEADYLWSVVLYSPGLLACGLSNENIVKIGELEGRNDKIEALSCVLQYTGLKISATEHKEGIVADLLQPGAVESIESRAQEFKRPFFSPQFIQSIDPKEFSMPTYSQSELGSSKKRKEEAKPEQSYKRVKPSFGA